MNIFSMDSMLGRFLYWIADIFILNILWTIFSLPIFTIGASTTALYYSMMQRQRRDESYIHKNFIKAFKENFKQSTILWLIMILVALVLFADLRIGLFFNINQNLLIGKIFIVVSVILMIPYLFVLLYIFPIQAKFENTIKDNLKNAILMAIGHLGYTLLLLMIVATFVVLTLFSRAFIGVEILFGVGLYAYLTSNVYITIFRKHLPDELEEDLEAIGYKHKRDR